MPILGITGGIASGKSTFRRLLLDRVEADSFDADACAHELLDEDAQVKDEISKRIGPQIYENDGRANRPLLRELVYQSAEKKRTLEAILHPVIRARWSHEAQEASAASRIFVVDIPLLFETKAETLFDIIVTVGCSLECQLTRLESRRGITREIAHKIIANQLPVGGKLAKSHHIVWNDGCLDALVSQADLYSLFLHGRYG